MENIRNGGLMISWTKGKIQNFDFVILVFLAVVGLRVILQSHPIIR